MKLSVIIPTLNEANHIGPTINALNQHSRLDDNPEIIVIDSGSVDDTRKITATLGAALISYIPQKMGRAYVLNEAVKYAHGDVLMFLDADTTVPIGYDDLIASALSDPKVIGGAFEFSLDGPDFGLRVVELINRVRYRIRQRFYGDQGIFVRANIFNRVGGYPEMGLLEAAHLCKNLRKEGKLKLIKKNIPTSPRRFIDGGIYRVLGNDIKIWFLDLIGLDVNRFANTYWEDNKLRPKS